MNKNDLMIAPRAFRRSRALLEKLEDRILLSAEPLLQQNKPEGDDGGLAEHLLLEALPDTRTATSQQDFQLKPTLLNLAKNGAGVGQSALLSWGVEGSLLNLNENLLNLVLDLGAGDNEVTLSQQDDGRMKLSGDSIYDLVFTKPTHLLGLIGGNGLDSIHIGQADLGAASFHVEAEHIDLGVNSRVISGGDIILKAWASLDEQSTRSLDLEASASLSVAGKLVASGDVVLESKITAQADITGTGPAIQSLDLNSAASTQVTGSARIEAGSLSVTAYTENKLTLGNSGGLGVLTVDVNQSTTAVVSGGARLVVMPSAGSDATSVLVEALDRSDLNLSLAADDKLISNLLGGFEAGLGTITFDRNTQAQLGDGVGEVTLSAADEADTGRVQVSAANVNGDNGGVTGEVLSSLIGVQSTTANSVVDARISGGQIKADGVSVMALDAGTYTAKAKVARQVATGSVSAVIVNSTIAAPSLISVLALDKSIFTSDSSGFSADVPKLNNVKLGIASASNTLDRSVIARIESSSLTAGDLTVLASQQQTASTNTESMAVTGGDKAGGSSLALGGTFAWNQLLGKVDASIVNSTAETADKGNIAVEAANASKVDSTTVAGISVAGAGSAGGASLAFNAIGWDMGNVAAATLNSLIGTDVATTMIPVAVTASIRGSQVKSGGDISVVARDLIELTASITNSSEASTGDAASALSIGAAAVLASNRVKSNTRAYIEGRDPATGKALKTVTAAGDVTVTADDGSSITADVAMSAKSSSAGGGSVAVGGIVVRNDVRSSVLGEVLGVVFDVGGSLDTGAVSSSAITATLSGEVEAKDAPAPAEEGADSSAASSESSASGVAVNGLIATNLILGQVEAHALDSVLKVAGSLSVTSENEATIEAENTAITTGSGAAVGATLAFNSIGWQSQNILYAALDALLGTSIGDEDPLTIRSEISGSQMEVGEDLTLTTVQVPQITATIVNEVSSEGSSAAVSFILASNLLSSQATVELSPETAEDAYTIGGNLDIKASDTAGISADISMEASSAGGAAVGGMVARNDVRNSVNTLVDTAWLDVEGDVTIEARGSATITAHLSGHTSSLSTEEAAATADAGGAAQSSPLAVNALIATNLILGNVKATVLDSDISAGGNLSVDAHNGAHIEAENEATTESGGTAVGVTLAFNTIGWAPQNLFANAIDALLGTSIGTEQSAAVDVILSGNQLDAGEDMAVTAEGEANITATLSNEVTSEAASAAASFILASNLVSSRTRISTGQSSTKDRDVSSLRAGNNLDLSAADTAGITATVTLTASSSGGAAVGGVVVRNDVRGGVDITTRDSTVSSGGDFSQNAVESASIEATAEGNVKTLNAEAAAPADAPASDAASAEPAAAASSPLAVNGLIATNLVLANATTLVTDSNLDVGGDLTVAADNTSLIVADNKAVIESDGAAVGVTLAFNTIGYAPQNLFANAIDALLGTQIGDAQPVTTSARVVATAFTAGGDVSVTAGAFDAKEGEDHGARITATIDNEAASNAASAGASFVLASNRVSSKSQAWVSPFLARSALEDETVDLSVGGSITVASVDSATIESDITMTATSGGGVAVGGVVVRNDIDSDVDAGMDHVNLSASENAAVIALQSATVTANLSGTVETPPAEEEAAADSTATGAASGATGAADASSSGSSSAGGLNLAVNAVIANNNILGTLQATLTSSTLTVGGDLEVEAQNEATVTAENTATVSSGGTAVGVTLAFNAIGWQPQDIFRKAVDALLGTSLGKEDPVTALATVDETRLDVAGDVTITANTRGSIEAITSNESSSEGGAAASMVLGTNFVSTRADAYLVQAEDTTLTTLVGGELLINSDDAPSVIADTTVSATSAGEGEAESDGEYARVDFNSTDGEQEIAFGQQVMVAEDHEAGGTGGRIYRYMGGDTTTLDLTETDYSDTGYWYELLPPKGKLAELIAAVEGAKMPFYQREVTLTTLPIAGQDYDVGFGAALGWQDLSVLDFLKGDADPKPGGVTATDSGLSFTVPSFTVGGHTLAGPELSLDLNLPNPQLPYYELEHNLGTIEHGGQSYDWGVRAALGWKDTQLLDLINLPALLEGRFEPVLPEFSASVYFGDVEIDSLHILPKEFKIQAPTVRLTLMDKPVELTFGGEYTLATPESLSDYIDPDKEPMDITLPTVDLDAIMGVAGVADRPDNYWDDALAIDASNPELPYFQKDLTFTTVKMGGQDWDVGLKAGIGWQDMTLLDLLTGDPVAGGVTGLDTGVHIQMPSLDIGDLSLQGPALDLELKLPDPELPYYEYNQPLGTIVVDGKDVAWGAHVSAGWKDMSLLDLIDVQSWLDGEFDPKLPELDVSLYMDLPDGATQVALPSSFDLELPSVKFTLLDKTVLLGFGDNLTVDTPEALADYIDPSLPPLSATLPSLDLDAALAGEFKTYTPTGDEISIDVTDGDSWKNGLLEFIQFIPDSYHLSDPELTGKLFGFPLDYT
ncbi:MAG: beta strand repeat-containing protein, partial [Methylococcaceae bacterium]